jgi:UDP-N-acetylmuramoylalanine--D-glutamate ligase
MQATEAALRELAKQHRPIQVIIGGVGKGVDRSTFCKKVQLMDQVKKIYTFGSESAFLGCSDSYKTLEELFEALKNNVASGDIILFSPGGASFDLFKNYEHRGTVFKDLVKKYFIEIH